MGRFVISKAFELALNCPSLWYLRFLRFITFSFCYTIELSKDIAFKKIICYFILIKSK